MIKRFYDLTKYKLATIVSAKLIKETAWSFLAQGSAFIFFIGLNLFLARYLGPDRFGEWSFFFSILSIVLLVSYLGINASARKFIAQHNETAELKAVLRSSVKLRVILSLVFALVMLSLSKPLAVWLDRPSFEVLFYAAAPLVFFASLVEYLKNAFQGLHRLKYDFYINLSEYGLKLLLAVCFLLILNEIIGLVFAFNLAFIVTTVLGFYFLYRHFYKNRPDSGTDYTRQLLQYSLPLFVISIGFLIATEIDTVMIGILSTDYEVGIYAVAKQIIIKLPHIALVISLGTMPLFAKLNQDNKEYLKALFYRLLKINTVIFGSIIILILAAGWYFIPLIFGAEYKDSVLPLVILIPYLIIYSYSIFLSSFLDYRGKARKRAINLIIALLLNLGLNLVLIPRYGAVGAAIATSVSYFPYLVLNWLEVRKSFQ
ncbi:MAG: flippase [Dehalococcoidia bacterium]